MKFVNAPLDMQGWVIMYAFAQLCFGFGIGGEYPMTSTAATDKSEEDRQHGQRHRGRTVMLAYTMQVSPGRRTLTRNISVLSIMSYTLQVSSGRRALV